MNADHDRDRALDRALKAAYSRGADAPVTPACLDPETLAAWIDGGLDAPSVAMAEAHASNCARCQAMLGTLARATPVVTADAAAPTRLWRWWFAPLAAGAAAVTLWMVVPTDRYIAPAQKKEIQAESQPATTQARDAVAPESPRPQPKATASAASRQAGKKLADNAVRENAVVVTAGSDESKARVEALMKADKPAERRDRTEPKALEEQGQIALPSGVQITATSSPSPNVTWFVGRGGVVLLTIDGRTVTRVPFPETTDLTAVTATDARTAVVTTSDGRIFRTDDGGQTWRRP